MKPDAHERARKVFLEARELEGELCSDFIAASCVDEEDLEIEVKSLLRHESEAHSFLASPILDVRLDIDWEALAEGADDQELAGTHIGHFEIIDKIGEGGMGVVYRARQDQPRRDVALKIIRAGLASAEARRRFDLEVEILGRLHHPGIAAIYEAGTLARQRREVPYFVMELIPEARSLIDFAGQEKLGLRQRLKLFAQVCDAVQHGHHHGVMHRDLKPDNILVDSAGQPKVIDFGIARSTNVDIAVTTMHTSIGELVGTVQYMSPEQCEGDHRKIDSRTDVYSLGIILYELVCGRPPYDVSGQSVISAMRLVREEEVPSPRSFRRDVHRDLERVMFKAIERDREQRYPSVADLAAETRRYLRGEPVSATTPGAWRRVSHWVGRHPIVATAAACLFLAATTISSTSVAVWWLGTQPFNVSIATDGSEASIIARNGRVLASFDGGGPGMILWAEKLRSGPSGSKRWRTAIAFHSTSLSPHAGRVIVIDPATPAKPLWITTTQPFEYGAPHPEIMGANDRYHSSFGVIVADVFPTAQGDELILSLSHARYSPSLIRVYGFDGQVLFQCWHDGAVHKLHWLSGPKLLLGAGMSNRLEPSDIGFRSDSFERYPQVVFAVKPRINEFHKTWLTSPDIAGKSATEWYKVLAPFEHMASIGLDAFFRSLSFDPSTHAQLRVEMIPIGLGQNVMLVIDQHGKIVDRAASDEYLNADGPQVSTLKLLDIVNFDPNTRPRTYD